MYLIGSEGLAIFFMLLSMFFMGTWPNFFKIRPLEVTKEYLFIVYSFTGLVVSIITGLTLGSYGSVGPNFIDNLHSAHPWVIVAACAGGVALGVSNLFLVLANQLVGIAIAMPISSGLSIIAGTTMNYLLDPVDRWYLLLVGIILVIIALVFESMSISQKQKYQTQLFGEEQISLEQRDSSTTSYDDDQSVTMKVNKNDSDPSERTNKADMKKGIILALISGIAGSFWSPLGAYSMRHKGLDGTLSAYASFFFLMIGFVVTNLVINIYLMYRPINQQPKSTLSGMFKMPMFFWFIGIAAGFICALGNLVNFIAGQSTDGYATSFAFARANTLVSGLYGVIIWKEFNNTNTITKVLYGIGMCFYLGALVALAFSL